MIGSIGNRTHVWRCERPDRPTTPIRSLCTGPVVSVISLVVSVGDEHEFARPVVPRACDCPPQSHLSTVSHGRAGPARPPRQGPVHSRVDNEQLVPKDVVDVCFGVWAGRRAAGEQSTTPGEAGERVPPGRRAGVVDDHIDTPLSGPRRRSSRPRSRSCGRVNVSRRCSRLRTPREVGGDLDSPVADAARTENEHRLVGSR
jgi:hypothetical protein